MNLQPMDVLAVLTWLGGSFFCGALPLGVAAVLFFTYRKRQRLVSVVSRAKKSMIAPLQADMGLVRLQGNISPLANALDGPSEKGLAYLRLKVERLQTDDGPHWVGFTDKVRNLPFQLEDGSGAVWVDPKGLDKQLLGEPVVPSPDQVQAACILLGISASMLRGRLRFFLWEMRSGQTLTVIGCVSGSPSGLLIVQVPGQPLVVSPLLGDALYARIAGQTNKARTWMLILGIPGALFLICALIAVLARLVQMLMGK